MMVPRRPPRTNQVRLSIDGAFACYPEEVSGGTIRGEVRTFELAPGELPQKHLASVSYTPLKFQSSFDVRPPLWNWLQESFEGRLVERTVSLDVCLSDDKETMTRTLDRAFIEEFTLPACDRMSTDAASWSCTLRPQAVRYDSNVASSGREIVEAKRWIPSNFRLEIGDLPCGRVRRVEGIRLTQAERKPSVGSMQPSGSKQPDERKVSCEFDNIRLAISAVDLREWQEWFDSFVVRRSCGESDQLEGSLSLLGADPHEELLRLSLDRVGILSLEQKLGKGVEGSGETFDVELYVEAIRFEMCPT